MPPDQAPAASDCARHRVRIVQSGEEYLCAESETLLQGMARIGRRGIPAGCLNGGCGVCKIGIGTGRVRRVGPMSRAHVSVEEEAHGVVLACRVCPTEAIEVDVVGKLRKAVTFQWSAARSAPTTGFHQAKET